MAKKRKIIPEILDNLAFDDPDAIRSRADLRRINFFMGNKRWILKEISNIATNTSKPLQIIEIGAGDGSLLETILNKQKAKFLGIDLIPKPINISKDISWLKSDIFTLETLPLESGCINIVICNLILHHFTHDELKELGKLLQDTHHIIAVEPLRANTPKLLGYLAYPFINHVTKHDMIASINAGFLKNELENYFPNKETFTETTSPRGWLRLHVT